MFPSAKSYTTPQESVPHSRADAVRGDSASQDSAWLKQEVKALKRALKCVPSSLDKNERFQTISTLVGGGRSKKECYSKYKELRAEAKSKRASIEPAKSAAAAAEKEAQRCSLYGSWSNTPSKLHDARDHDDDRRYHNNRHHHLQQSGGDTSPGNSVASRQDSGKSSSSKPGLGEQQPQQQPQQRQRRRSAASASIFLSSSPEPPEDAALRAEDEYANGSAAATEDFEQRGGNMMMVEEIDIEDFCLDGELEEHTTTSRTNEDVAAGDRGSGLCSGVAKFGGGGNLQRHRLGGPGDKSPRAITESEALGVRELIFGDCGMRFNDAWREQGFYFCQGVSGLGYGLVQAEGGPCGVLAAVQAFLLECLLFRDQDSREQDWANPGKKTRQSALVVALSIIIWRAGDGSTATLALSERTSTVQASSRYKPDGVTERLKFYVADSRSSLEELLWKYLHCFTEKKGHGVILLVYSCLFTRGLELARRDMDKGFGAPPTMMARHGYASQELVNLLLLGRAHSNVFDGQRTIDEGCPRERAGGEIEGSGSDRVVLTGAPARGKVGFLTLFEAYKHVEVGNHLKTPESPVWVVCSESHYSVLFSDTSARLLEQHPKNNNHSTDADDTLDIDPPDTHGRDGMSMKREGWGREAEEKFDLLYYDGLGRQDEVIRLTVDPTAKTRHPPQPSAEDASKEAMMVPPLDLVIRTRWPGASVDWNGTDPLL